MESMDPNAVRKPIRAAQYVRMSTQFFGDLGEQVKWATAKGPRKEKLVHLESTNFMERRLVMFQVLRRTVCTDMQFHSTLKDAQTAHRHESAKTTSDIYICICMQPVPRSVSAALNARTKLCSTHLSEVTRVRSCLIEGAHLSAILGPALGPSMSFPTTEIIQSITQRSAESITAIANAGTHLLVHGTNRTNGI